MPIFQDHDLSLAYRSFGRGPTPIIAFHGFGRTGDDFPVFEKAMGDRFTIHAFDLPFHGASIGDPARVEKPFEPEELGRFFSAFADGIEAKQFVLMGYSLGGRVALSLLENIPERISHAVLIAPDGLKKKPWYRALASSAWGRRHYAEFLDRPKRVQWVIRTAHRIGLINDRLHRFLTDQISTREKRELVHDVWLSFRHIEPDLDHVAAELRAHQLTVTLVLGAKDSVIKPRPAARFQAKAPTQCSTVRMDTGHQLLTAELAERLKVLLA